MSLTILSSQLQQIHQQMQAAYPNEGCGLLIGCINPDRSKTTREVWPVENAWTSQTAARLPTSATPNPQSQSHSRQDRYWIDPKVLLTAQRDSCDRGLSIIGIYHSHPDYPATPSECDRAWAWPEYSYLILSVVQGVVHESRSWCLDAHHQFAAEALLIDP